MVNQQLLDFIKMQLEKGVDKELISTQLLSNDWTRQDIEEGFQSAGTGIEKSTTTIPPVINYNQSTVGDNDGVVITEKHHTGRKIFLTLLILCALGGAAYYFKSELLNLPFVSKIFPQEKTEMLETENQSVDELSSISDTETESKTLPITETEQLPVVGDYEIKILSPLENSRVFIGQPIIIQVLAGKEITKIVNVNISGHFVSPSDPKPLSFSQKNEKGIFTVEYIIPEDFPFIGKKDLHVMGYIEDTMGTAPVEKSFKSIQVVVDSPKTPVNLHLLSDLETLNGPITVKLGGIFVNGKQVPQAPMVGVDFSGSGKADALISDTSVVTYKIHDESIAVIEEIPFLQIGDSPENLAINIKGLKVGTTKLTVTYKGISTTIDVIVVN